MHSSDTPETSNYHSIDMKMIQKELKVKGEFTTIVRNNNCGARTMFIVIKGYIGTPSVIGRDTLQELRMLKIEPAGPLKESNELRIKTIKQKH